MSYLRFEKALMTNLQDSLPKELLRTNRSGAYSCSTIVDCNIRKYHGLLVVPVPELDDENHVLLSSLDCTVIQHGAEFNLGLHKYQGNNYSPKGHKYIREFDCDKIPTTIYRVGGVILKKEFFFQNYEDRILIRYTLVDAHSATTLRFRPFLAFRSVRQFTHENSVASREYHQVDNGIKTCMYAGYPDLYMQFSKKNEFVFQPDWYRGVEYPKEQERGYASNEDLYVPGYFEMSIRKGESIVFAASTSETKTARLKKLFEDELALRPPRDNFFHCLVNAAHQFHMRVERKEGEKEYYNSVQDATKTYYSNDDRYLLAGYPWFKCRARDTFISLPGLTLSIGEDEYFELVMDTAERGLREFMEQKPPTTKIYEIDKPDVPLWAVWAIQQYCKKLGKARCKEKYRKLLRDIITFIEENKHPNMTLEDNGLVRIEGRDVQIRIEDLDIDVALDIRCGDFLRSHLVDGDALGIRRTAEFDSQLLQVEDAFRHIFLADGNGRKLMEYPVDLDRGDSSARQRAQKNSSHAVAKSGAIASFERLNNKLSDSSVFTQTDRFYIRLFEFYHQ